MEISLQPKRRGLALASVLGVLLFSCADAAGPSEAAAREVLEAGLRDGLAKGAIRIKSFQKTSGPINVPPGDTYVVAFRAEIECLKDYSGRYCGRGCKQGTMLRVEEGSGRTKISYDTPDPSGTVTQSGTNLSTGTAFTQTYGSAGRLASYEEENKWAGLKFTKTWRAGWRIAGSFTSSASSTMPADGRELPRIRARHLPTEAAGIRVPLRYLRLQFAVPHLLLLG